MDLKSILSPNEEKRPHSPAASLVQAGHNSKPSTPFTSTLSNYAAQPPTVPSAASSAASSSPHKRHQERASSLGPSVPATTTATGSPPATLSHPRIKHASPLTQTPLSNVPSHVMSPLQQQQNAASPLISPVPFTPGTPHAGIPRTQQSTPSLETLADLASSHSQHQSSRPPALHASSLESIRSLDSLSRASATQVSLTTNARASFDINMMEVPKQSWRTDFSDVEIDQELRTTLIELASYLNETPYAYQAHISYVNSLRKAFVNYVSPPSDDGTMLHDPNRSDAQTFPLLSELHFARSAMHKLFAPGEDIWLDWLQDKILLARSLDSYVEVVELFDQAVAEEPMSCRLWLLYGNFVTDCYQRPQLFGVGTEDEQVAREVFSWQMVQDTWQRAINDTSTHLASSHIVWNAYITSLIRKWTETKDKELAQHILKLFESRLRAPHIESASTKAILIQWLNDYFPKDHADEIIQDLDFIMKGALRDIRDRLASESAIEEARSVGDQDAEYKAYTDYLVRETTPVKRKGPDFDLCDALYRRCETRFPTDVTIWEDHIAFILEQGQSAVDLLSLATKHCPWSGSLWSQSLLASERANQSYEATEGIKHRATSTGILEAAGIEEVIKVHAAWCSYLRRRAFRADHDEDDADIAEIGIRASIESIDDLGAKLGMENVADPSFRIHRIYINFLSESDRWDNARREFDSAVGDYGTSWNFWIRFYHWEMKRWRRFATKDPDEEPLLISSPPHLATAVLLSALDQAGLDYPEPIIEALLHHCEDYESADETQSVLLKIRKVEKGLAARRQIEAAQSAQAATANMQTSLEVDPSAMLAHPKRKHEEVDNGNDIVEFSKRSRTEEAVATVEQTPADNPKRDREHASILVQNLPENVSEAKIRQFFTSCGTVKALKMIDNGTSAIVEFDDDSAAHYALSRDGQQLDDNIIHVVLDTGSTVFLTNYSPETGEAEIRAMLSKYGEIISIRLPSLQGNKNRRFCYVQFKLPGQAQDAVDDLDDKEIDGLALTCKISNPAVKKSRQDAHETDGRTLFVRQINFKATEDEVKQALTVYGIIEKIRMPRHEKNKDRNKGIAFITYTTLAEANAALAFDGKQIKGREVRIELADKQQAHRQASVTPQANGKARQASSAPSEDLVLEEPRSERTIFLSNVPDTVNEARLRSVASKSGEVKKVILKTTHQGALIEFVSVAAAGEAALAMDGYEISTDRKLRVVSEEEMKTQKAEKKVEGFGARPKPKAAAPITASGVIKRPTQPGVRKGGNLGHRNALLHKGSDASKEEAAQSNGAPAKSNADFRAMLTGGKKE